MSPTEGPRAPTMVDVAAAVAVKDGAESPALDALSWIAAHMDAERQHREGLIQTWWRQSVAENLAMRDGIRHALATSEWGGTSRQYEATLSAVRFAVDAARDRHSEVRRWYDAQVEEHGEFGDHVRWPGYEMAGGLA